MWSLSDTPPAFLFAQVARAAPAGDVSAEREAPLQPQLLPVRIKLDTPPAEDGDSRGGPRRASPPARPSSEAAVACQAPGCANADGMRGAYHKRVR